MEKIYENLMQKAYDDNHGITIQRQDYEKIIKELNKKKNLSKSDKLRLELAKKDLKNFKPQWISVDDLKKEYTKFENLQRNTKDKFPLMTFLLFIWASIMLFWNNLFFGNLKLTLFLWTLIGVTLFRWIYLFGKKEKLWNEYTLLEGSGTILVLVASVLLILRIVGVLPQ